MQTTIPNIDARSLTPAQRKALRCKDTQLLVSGGFGSGKTTAHALKVLQLKRINVGIPGLILAQTWGMLWSTTLRRLFSVLRKCGVGYRVRDRQGECYLDLGDGVPIFLRSAKNIDTFDGLDVGWETGDETRHWKHDAYLVALARRRVKCPLPQAAFFSTPNMWLLDEFTGKPGRRMIIAPTRENARNLTPGYIDNLRLSYSPRMQKAYIDGEAVILEGAVFEEFDAGPSSPWLVDYDARRWPQRKTILAVDPGYRRSAWILIHQIHETEWIVFDELMLDDTNDITCAQRVNALKYPIDEIWIDPAADNVQSIVGIDILQALRTIQTRGHKPIRMVTDPWRAIPYGVDKLRTMLGGEGLPMRILFARKLYEQGRGNYRGIIKDLASLRYPEMKDGKPVSDHPLKDGIRDHSCDCLRYFAVGMWLTSPLRRLDPVLNNNTSPGWRVATA